MFTPQKTRKLLFEFARRHLCVTNKNCLVPEVIAPQGYKLMFQDQSEVQSENDDGVFEGVLCDIFRNDQDYRLHVSFVNDDNKIVVDSVSNLKLEQVFQAIAMYDGEGTWDTNCGRLVKLIRMKIQKREPHLRHKLFDVKFVPTANATLKQCIQTYKTKPNTCTTPFCNAKIEFRHYCLFHARQCD